MKILKTEWQDSMNEQEKVNELSFLKFKRKEDAEIGNVILNSGLIKDLER